jgi:hypothetical protein
MIENVNVQNARIYTVSKDPQEKQSLQFRFERLPQRIQTRWTVVDLMFGHPRVDLTREEKVSQCIFRIKRVWATYMLKTKLIDVFDTK